MKPVARVVAVSETGMPFQPIVRPMMAEARGMTLIAGLVPLVLALQLDKTAYPWASSTVLLLLGGAALALVLFVLRSLRSANPILNLGLFRNRVFSTSNLALFFLGGAFLSILIFLPLFMVNVVGVSATQAGSSLIPLSLGLVFGSIVAGCIVAMILFQVFINVGMNVGIMPITGIPLPLMSYGGSSVLTTLLAVGLLQSIHVQARASQKGRRL